jgi:hypothetical protein
VSPESSASDSSDVSLSKSSDVPPNSDGKQTPYGLLKLMGGPIKDVLESLPTFSVEPFSGDWISVEDGAAGSVSGVFCVDDGCVRTATAGPDGVAGDAVAGAG